MIPFILLRVELWCIWHMCCCACGYYFGFIPVFDWLLLFLYVFTHMYFVHFVFRYIKESQSSDSSLHKGILTIVISQIPNLLVAITVSCVLFQVFYSDVPIVILQLSSIVYCPIVQLLPDMEIMETRLYVWIMCGCMWLQSITMIVYAWIFAQRIHSANS